MNSAHTTDTPTPAPDASSLEQQVRAGETVTVQLASGVVAEVFLDDYFFGLDDPRFVAHYLTGPAAGVSEPICDSSETYLSDTFLVGATLITDD